MATNPNEIYNNPAAGDLERMLAAIAMQLARIAKHLETQPVTPPECAHGPRVHRTGESDRGPWQAWMCPLPKDRKAEQCEPLWIDR